MKNIIECDCSVCTLNGRQGRKTVLLNDHLYCTASSRYKLASTIVKNSRKVENYVLSFIDHKSIEQDFFIRAKSESDAVGQAQLVLLLFGCNKRNATLVKEKVINL